MAYDQQNQKQKSKGLMYYEFFTSILKISIIIDDDVCIKCLQCVNNCSPRAMQVIDNKIVINDDKCIKCLQCFCICPKKAISYNGITGDDAENVYQENISNPTMKAIMERKSIRHFKQQPIDQETLNNILQIAKYCPSGMNTRNIEFYVLGRETIDKIVIEVAKTLGFEKVQQKVDIIFRGAPHCIVAVADKNKQIFKQDGTIFLETIDIAAQTFNFGTFWDGFFNRAMQMNPEIPKIIGIPEDKQILGCMGIGYKDIQYKRTVLREKL